MIGSSHYHEHLTQTVNSPLRFFRKSRGIEYQPCVLDPVAATAKSLHHDRADTGFGEPIHQAGGTLGGKGFEDVVAPILGRIGLQDFHVGFGTVGLEERPFELEGRRQQGVQAIEISTGEQDLEKLSGENNGLGRRHRDAPPVENGNERSSV